MSRIHVRRPESDTKPYQAGSWPVHVQESAEVDTPRPARGGGVKQSEVSHCEAMITLMPENICYNYMFIFPHQPLFHVFLFSSRRNRIETPALLA